MIRIAVAATVFLLTFAAVSSEAAPPTLQSLLVRTLDGRGNNVFHPDWGTADTQYLRVAPPRYADGIGAMAAGPSPRAISNRVFNDVGQNLFSEHGVTQWGWVWGQFIDHDVGLRDETPAEDASMPSTPPTRSSRSRTRSARSRSPARRRRPAPASTTPRQQINTIVELHRRLAGLRHDRCAADWLRRAGEATAPRCCSPAATCRGGRARRRGDAPPMDLMGQLAGTPRTRSSPATSARTRTSR